MGAMRIGFSVDGCVSLYKRLNGTLSAFVERSYGMRLRG